MLILASASPRRRELLTQAGLLFTVAPAEINEEALAEEAAAAYVQRVATEKAQVVCAAHRHLHTEADPLVVLAADTTVVLTDGTILGKPENAHEAAEMLAMLSGRTHAVMTGLCVISLAGGEPRTCSDVEITQVSVDLISAEEIAAYVATGEPLDKAGAYAIQGYAARWIPRIDGDYFNVVGLPIARTIALMAEASAKSATANG